MKSISSAVPTNKKKRNRNFPFSFQNKNVYKLFYVIIQPKVFLIMSKHVYFIFKLDEIETRTEPLPINYACFISLSLSKETKIIFY